MLNNIKIGGLNYSVKKVKDLARDHAALGRCCGNSASIEIDMEIGKNVTDKVLLHEIIEAINFEYELNLEHNKISILAMALHQVLSDNKGLLKDNE